ncbi:uncharacterized protein NFIA_090900 [Aspergillus fischeri NRRL 181]|uniref:Uncharacterized protein n=1 Tax=Neosartorya fischeri (strain ATCC 1020 / DSM 3700 / CBS 544.65 / FGSC A1164 / JCM 1740 / NRRL 181 / WB 181) TaxID=331117 RepID=A1DIC5_NEOFI|nr:conserved hypothetical protein [Aspergillus fischeri NRRL 181]EAW19132.1 conserved hypothetical protein [Aspergillus fischeri NRRL 181]
MPRTLPWLIGSGTKAEDAKSSPRRREAKHEKGSDHSAEETPKASKSTSRKEKRDFFRSWFDKDDIYMMVEDEFYAMAQTFTKHLHYAEYVKRKEAKLQNAAAIKDLARPTDGVTPRSEETKRKDAAAALSARQRAGLEKMGGKRPQLDSDKEEDDTDEDDGLAGTSLGYLMTSPRKARSLVGMQGVKSSTRAAAGFAQASGSKRQKTNPDAHTRSSLKAEIEADDHAAGATATEDDDLDVQITKTSTRPTEKKHSIGSDANSPVLRTSSSTPQYAANDDKGKRPVRIIHRTPPLGRSRRKVFFDDFDELPEPSNPNPSAHGRLKSHTANNTKDPNESATIPNLLEISIGDMLRNVQRSEVGFNIFVKAKSSLMARRRAHEFNAQPPDMLLDLVPCGRLSLNSLDCVLL